MAAGAVLKSFGSLSCAKYSFASQVVLNSGTAMVNICMGVIYGFLFGLVWSRENEGEVAEKNKRRRRHYTFGHKSMGNGMEVNALSAEPIPPFSKAVKEIIRKSEITSSSHWDRQTCISNLCRAALSRRCELPL